jgi:hypothetical protein
MFCLCCDFSKYAEKSCRCVLGGRDAGASRSSSLRTVGEDFSPRIAPSLGQYRTAMLAHLAVTLTSCGQKIETAARTGGCAQAASPSGYIL